MNGEGLEEKISRSLNVVIELQKQINHISMRLLPLQRPCLDTLTQLEIRVSFHVCKGLELEPREDVGGGCRLMCGGLGWAGY